jgi:excisionase family DNA binding protein
MIFSIVGTGYRMPIKDFRVLAERISSILAHIFFDTEATMSEELLYLAAAANFLRISPEVLRRHARNGVIPARKEGRFWRFSRRDLEEWLHKGGPQVAMDEDASPWGK